MSRVPARTTLVALALLASGCSSQQAAPSAQGGAAQVQPGATLLATVGTAEDPEAYEIALTTQDGQAVDTVAAGSYTVVVDDRAEVHNFHLSGPGVDVASDVEGTGEKTFEVTLQPGEYRYLCDPHPSMRGDLRVL